MLFPVGSKWNIASVNSPVQLELTAQLALKSKIALYPFESPSAQAIDPLVSTSEAARPGLKECVNKWQILR